MQDARLGTGVGFELQRVVVLPGDMQPRGHTQDAGGAIGLTLFTRRVILGCIPGVGKFSPCGVDRNGLVVAFERRKLPVAPVLGDE